MRFHRVQGLQLKGACSKAGEELFTRTCGARTRTNGLKLREGRFGLGSKKKFFS